MGGWIAGFFAILNFDWLQRSYLGGSEPLFGALLFGSFLLVRKDRWLLAALLASLATVVRPLGIFALVGIGVALLWKRNYRTLLLAILIGGTEGGFYALPLTRHFGESARQREQLSQSTMGRGLAVRIPFLRHHQGYVDRTGAADQSCSEFWLDFCCPGRDHGPGKERPLSRICAQSHPRDDVPDSPTLIFGRSTPTTNRIERAAPSRALPYPFSPSFLLALDCWLPKDKRVLWTLAVVSPILAAASAVGIGNVCANSPAGYLLTR